MQLGTWNSLGLSPWREAINRATDSCARKRKIGYTLSLVPSFSLSLRLPPSISISPFSHSLFFRSPISIYFVLPAGSLRRDTLDSASRTGSVAPSPPRLVPSAQPQHALVHDSTPKRGGKRHEDAARVAHGQLKMANRRARGRGGGSHTGTISP